LASRTNEDSDKEVEMIKTAYVSGALTGVPEEEAKRLKEAYEAMAEACKRSGIDAYVPHLHSDPDKHAHISAEVVYEMDTKEVLARDLLILDASRPSHGVGGEAVHASLAGKPIVLCYASGIRVSRYIRGIPGVRAEIGYASLADLHGQLGAWLDRHKG
jgi:2'-deoxynucleoside 5'-phosphate N-hydrolase